MSFEIKHKVRCSDREVGEVTRVIADPIAKSISHLVVLSDGQEWVIPAERATLEGDTVVLSCPASGLSEFPRLRREDFVELREMEVPGLERHLEGVVPGEVLVRLPEMEKDPSRRSFFVKMTNAIGVVLALPLLYPITRYLTNPLYQPLDNTWFKIGSTKQLPELDVPQLVSFKREIQEGYLKRVFNKSHWVVRASEALREKIFGSRTDLFGATMHEYRGNQDQLIWKNDPKSEVVVFSGKCPHLGCAYRWKENHKRFGRVYWCPCHLSIFAPNGDVVDGPAPRPLDVMPSRVNPAGQIEVIDAEFKAGRTDIIRIL